MSFIGITSLLFSCYQYVDMSIRKYKGIDFESTDGILHFWWNEISEPEVTINYSDTSQNFFVFFNPASTICRFESKLTTSKNRIEGMWNEYDTKKFTFKITQDPFFDFLGKTFTILEKE